MPVILFFGKKNPNTICLGTGETDKDWYYMTDEVKDFISKYDRGTEVEFECKAGPKGKILTFIKPKAGATQKDATSCATPGVTVGGAVQTNKYGKSKEECDSIKRQAIGHMVSRTIIGLQGSVDINNVTSVMDTLYKKYVELVG